MTRFKCLCRFKKCAMASPVNYIKTDSPPSSPRHPNMYNPLTIEIGQSNTMLNEGSQQKGSFCIDALLGRDKPLSHSPSVTSRSPQMTSRSPSRSPSPISSSASSPPISPGSELPNRFIPRPGLMHHHPGFPPNGSAIYGYPPTTTAHLLAAQGSAFHPLDGTPIGPHQKPNMGQLNPGQLHHMQLEWLARTGMFYPRIPDLSGKYRYLV